MTTLRELKYVLLGDDRLSNKLNGVSRSGYKASEALNDHSKKLAKLRSNFKDAADEIPGLNQGLAMLSNPLVLGAAGAVALGAGIRSAVNEAKLFNSTFRELSNLNLDKSEAELKRLKGLVRDVAFDKGFDQNLTSKAFFDVQSVTGKYGGEVARIVEQQGEFANIFKADFNSWIAGTAKAMANYGFGADRLDEFNKASYAAFKTAAITFDELAKVQSVYAGAAASAKQSFSSANKMLSLFTLKTKSADEAATLTKSLFVDLTKKETIDSLKKIGIEFFDTNKKVKQADQILLELNSKFRALGNNDKDVMNLKNQFTGSEGLIAFVQTATDKSGNLINTLNGFDASELALNKALDLARKDTDYINDQLGRRTKVLMGEIGDMFIPVINKGAEFLNYTLTNKSREIAGGYLGEQKGRSQATKKYDYMLYDASKLSDEQYKEASNKLAESIKNAEIMANKLKLLRFMPGEGRYQYSMWDAYATGLKEIQKSSLDLRKSGLNLPGANGIDNSTGVTDSKLTNGIDSISGGGNAIRNITVNIQKLIETQQINTQNLTEGTTQIQQLVEAALIRAVAGTEQMMAN